MVREECEWFNVIVGLHQGRVMSQWLLNFFMDWIKRDVIEKAGDVGASLFDAKRK